MNLVSLDDLNRLRFPQSPVPMPKLWRWCRNGELPARKIGGEWYVDLDAFDTPQASAAAKPEAGKVVRLVLDRLKEVR